MNNSIIYFESLLVEFKETDRIIGSATLPFTSGYFYHTEQLLVIVIEQGNECQQSFYDLFTIKNLNYKMYDSTDNS